MSDTYSITIKGVEFLVDAADSDLAATYRWFLLPGGYLATSVRRAGRQETWSLHRMIAGAARGQVVDHIDGDLRNCRRSNLRITDRLGNSRNRRVISKTGYKGVRVHKQGRPFMQIGLDKRDVYMGAYPTIEAAAHAYDLAAMYYFGDFARLNFPVVLDPNRKRLTSNIMASIASATYSLQEAA